MRTRWNGTVLTVLLLAMACGGSGSTEPPAVQRLAHGIVAGNNQSTVAGTAQLSGAVVEQMVQNASGTLSLRRIPDTWQDRAVDWLVPRAFAQGTVVNGSPVVGAVVCAVNVDTTYKLTAFVPCTNTDADGKAVFFFTPGTKAGVAKAEIRGTYQSQPAVFDTARATVIASTPYQMAFGVTAQPYGFQLGDLKVGTVIDLRARITKVVDRYGNILTDWTPTWAFSADSTTPRDWEGRLANYTTWKAALPAGLLTNTGTLAIVPANAKLLIIAIGADTNYNTLRAVP